MKRTIYYDQDGNVVNDEEVRRIIKKEAAHAGNTIGAAIIIAAVCVMVTGICWAAAWMFVSVR